MRTVGRKTGLIHPLEEPFDFGGRQMPFTPHGTVAGDLCQQLVALLRKERACPEAAELRQYIEQRLPVVLAGQLQGDGSKQPGIMTELFQFE